ncbi:MAG: HDIG domain-containing protein [Anaerolineales bacterium]
MNPTTKRSSGSVRDTISLFGLLFLVTALSATALLVPLPTAPDAVPLELGDVASQDILAPREIHYQSTVLTELQQDQAASDVTLVYGPPDASVARLQVDDLRAALTFISIVREDEYATLEQKQADLSALEDITLTPESMDSILGMSDTVWQNVRGETIGVLEEVMPNTIREDQLEDVRRSIPARVSLSFTEEQTVVIAEIVSAFVAPNSLYSETLTEEHRQAARDAVEPVLKSYKVNETVVNRGSVITAVDLEALEQLGLLEEETDWTDRLSVITLVVVNFAFVSLYLAQRPDLRSDNRSILLMAFLFLIFLYGARLIIPNRTVIPFLFPIAGFSMVVAALISSRVAMILAVPLSILAGYGLANSLELILFYLFSSMFGVLVLRNIQRILTFFWAGIAAFASGTMVILTFRLVDPTTDLIGIVSLIGAAGFNGLAAAGLTIILQFVLAQVLGLTTTLQLLEISRPDHELLQLLLRNAPGTYQHSLQIANLAEQAADAIGADTLLTRVGSLYHDVGKARHPHYFIENQAPGSTNPHEDLNPLESSGIIVRHVTDGIDLANKYRLPRRIKDFILEHHGDGITSYQYHQAVEAAGGDSLAIDQESYSYPGPNPQSRETALVMLADGVEARARAERPETLEDVSALVKDIIDRRLSQGLLNDTPLTMRDLSDIAESFTTTLRGVYHPRIEYPKTDNTTRSIPKDSPPPQ